MNSVLAIKLEDQDAERVRLSHARAIDDLQNAPAASLIVIGDFLIPNSGSTLVDHRLGRKPSMVILSPPRVEFGTPGLVAGGIVIDLPGPGVDRSKQVRIFATGYGVAITVTVAVL